MSAPDSNQIVFDTVSKFYGDVLGVNKVHLRIPPGITSLVGPNGSGKTTLMNLVTGLLHPSQGSVRVLGMGTDDPERMFRAIGYCTQFDTFPRGATGRQFIEGYLRVHGHDGPTARRMTTKALERVNLVDAASRRIAAYSKGMRQRIKLAQAIAHEPTVLVLDEPLNGLDPMARAEMIALFGELAHADRHVIISSHILHEVDLISDQVILLNEGYVVAEGDIGSVRDEMQRHPQQVLVRCDRPAELASRVFREDGVVEVKLHEDGQGLLIRTTDADGFFLAFNDIVVDGKIAVQSVAPADADVHAVYQYLIGNDRSES